MDTPIAPTQKRYARVLLWVAAAGQIALFAGYVVYLTGLLPPRVPPQRIAQEWHLSAPEFTRKLELQSGWSWVRHIGSGDVVSYATVVFLALGTNICLLVAAASYIREKNRKYAVIVMLQIVVLLIAASGLVTAGSY